MQSVMRPEYGSQPESRMQRSGFDRSCGWKGTFDAGLLIPFFVDEAIPGDVFKVNTDMFIRLATSLRPTMDNLKASVHFWSCPWRVLWDNSKKFFGERTNPADSIDYTIPQTGSYSWAQNSLGDYMGIPPGINGKVNALPLRMYNFVYDEFYRAQELINSATFPTDDGPDGSIGATYFVRRRGKRPDYFTTGLTAPQKGEAVSIPLGTTAPIFSDANTGQTLGIHSTQGDTVFRQMTASTATLQANTSTVADEGMFADLTNASSATIIALRQSIAIQQFLEIDARGGTRFAEVIWAHFGTDFQDVRYRPEYLGGGTFDVIVNPIHQTSAQSTPTTSDELGQLAGIGTGRGGNMGFTKAFDEWCYILGIVCVDADLNYQQGLDRLWSRQTRYDLFWPTFAFIGDQAIRNDEIYWQGTAADSDPFAYAPRYEDYRWGRNLVTGLFRSSASGTLESWHYAEDFASLPTLGQTFIESNPPIDRTIGVPSQPHFIADVYNHVQCARPIPLNGIPGLTRL